MISEAFGVGKYYTLHPELVSYLPHMSTGVGEFEVSFLCIKLILKSQKRRERRDMVSVN